MNIFGWWKKKKERSWLGLDFGEDSVKGIVFRVFSNKSEIKNYQEQKLERFGVFDGKEFEKDLFKKAFSKLIEKLGIKEQFPKFPKRITFSTNLLKAKIFSFSFQRKKEREKITEKEREEIYNFVLEKAQKEITKRDEFEILKKKIIEQKVGGYLVSSLTNLRGKNLDFKILTLFSSRSDFQLIESLKKELFLQKGEISHRLEGVSEFLRSKKENSGIFIGVEARATLIGFFQKTLIKVVDFPIGWQNFSQKISQQLGVRKKEGEEIIEKFSKDQFSSEIKEKIKKIIEPIFDQWEKKLREELKQELSFAGFPQKVYLFGGGTILSGLKERIEKIEKIKEGKVNFLFPADLPIENQTLTPFSLKETSSLLITLPKEEIYEKKDYRYFTS